MGTGNIKSILSLNGKPNVIVSWLWMIPLSINILTSRLTKYSHMYLPEEAIELKL
jgi:hypothetical protein